MISTLADAWANLRDVPNIVGILVGGVTALITATVTLLVALIAALISVRNTRKTLDHAKETLGVAKASTARTASTFIADKRQKWIDDLRSDMALYIANTHELVALWLMFTQAEGKKYDDYGDQETASAMFNAYLDAYSKLMRDTAERDAAHQQVLTRIRFRLNPSEAPHLELLKTLYGVRHTFETMLNLIGHLDWTASRLSSKIYIDLEKCSSFTQAILKGEWNRLNREVAEPEKLLEKIIATSPPDVTAIAATLQTLALSIRPSMLPQQPSSTSAPHPNT